MENWSNSCCLLAISIFTASCYKWSKDGKNVKHSNERGYKQNPELRYIFMDLWNSLITSNSKKDYIKDLADLCQWPPCFLVVLQNRADVHQRLGALNNAADGRFQGLVFSHKLNKDIALLLSVKETEIINVNENNTKKTYKFHDRGYKGGNIKYELAEKSFFQPFADYMSLPFSAEGFQIDTILSTESQVQHTSQ